MAVLLEWTVLAVIFQLTSAVNPENEPKSILKPRSDHFPGDRFQFAGHSAAVDEVDEITEDWKLIVDKSNDEIRAGILDLLNDRWKRTQMKEFDTKHTKTVVNYDVEPISARFNPADRNTIVEVNNERLLNIWEEAVETEAVTWDAERREYSIDLRHELLSRETLMDVYVMSSEMKPDIPEGSEYKTTFYFDGKNRRTKSFTMEYSSCSESGEWRRGPFKNKWKLKFRKRSKGIPKKFVNTLADFDELCRERLTPYDAEMMMAIMDLPAGEAKDYFYDHKTHGRELLNQRRDHLTRLSFYHETGRKVNPGYEFMNEFSLGMRLNDPVRFLDMNQPLSRIRFYLSEYVRLSSFVFKPQLPRQFPENRGKYKHMDVTDIENFGKRRYASATYDQYLMQEEILFLIRLYKTIVRGTTFNPKKKREWARAPPKKVDSLFLEKMFGDIETGREPEVYLLLKDNSVTVDLYLAARECLRESSMELTAEYISNMENVCRELPRKRSAGCTIEEEEGEWTIDESNSKVTEDGVQLELESEVTGKRVTIERNIPEKYSAGKLALDSWAASQNRKPSSFHRSVEIAGKVNRFFGRFALVSSILNGAYMIQQNRFGEAAQAFAFGGYFAAAELGAISGVRKIAAKATMKVATAVAKAVVKIESIGKVTDTAAVIARTEALGGSLTKFAGKIMPVAGFLVGLFAVGQDIYQLAEADKTDVTKLVVLSVNLILDLAMTGFAAASSAFPPLEIVVAVITVVRMFLESVVNSVADALENCPYSDLKALCFIAGVAEGIFDVLSNGYFTQMRELRKEEAKFRNKIDDLNKVESYLSIRGDCNGTEPVLIDFNAGVGSSYGGGVSFKLLENQDYEISIDGVPIYGKGNHTIKKTLHCEMLRNIMLGNGETAHFSYEEKEAKAFFFVSFHSKSFLMIGDELQQESSLVGSYTGNSKDNSFHAVGGISLMNQRNIECPKLNLEDKDTKKAAHYSYRLFGKAGNDRFILGPQKAFVQAAPGQIVINYITANGTLIIGGEGKDLYVISSTGGETVIDNFAIDKMEDTLLLGINLENIECARDGTTLVIKYCSTHVVKIMKWFMPGDATKHRHLTILTKDKSTIEIFHDSIKEGSHSEYGCWLTAIHKDGSDGTTNADLSFDKKYRYVRKVISSSGKKRTRTSLRGNDLPNILIGIGNQFFLQGGKGNDQYVVPNKTIVEIDNRDMSNEPREDRVTLAARYNEVVAVMKGKHLVLSARKVGLKLTMLNWFESTKRQHATFLTNDNLVFGIKEKNKTVIKVPYILDYSHQPEAVRVDLKKQAVPYLSKGIVLTEMRSIISSEFDDYIVANGLDSMFVCRGNGVYIAGGGGEDTYHVTEKCRGTLDLNSTDAKKSTIQLHCGYSHFWVCHDSSETSLNFICLPEGNRFSYYTDGVFKELCKTSVKLLNWNTPDGKSKANIISTDGYGMVTDKTFTVKTQRRFTRVDSLEINTIDHPLCCRLKLKEAKDHIIESESTSDYLEFTSVVKINVNNTDSEVEGNDQANLFQGGGKINGYKSILKGGKGADFYRVQAGDGKVEINNYATDGARDVIEIGIPFDHIAVAVEEDSGTVLLFDEEDPTRTQVKILQFWRDKAYRHADFKSSDHVKFILLAVFPYKEAQIIDFSFSKYPEVIQPQERGSGCYGNVREIYGSHFASNTIFGTKSTLRILGGLRNDSIDGGDGDEIIEGYDGDDLIIGRGGDDILKGGAGNDTILGGGGSDVIRGGRGSDIIDGGLGVDFYICDGSFQKQKKASSTGDMTDILEPVGAEVNLRVGIVRNGNLESDTLLNIEAVMGTAFDDTIEDNDEDNEIDAGPGDDKMISHGGRDRLVGDMGQDSYDLRRASGRKIIDNFDNHSKSLQLDRLLFDLDSFPTWPENKGLPRSISDLLKCSFKHRNHFYLIFINGLRVILEDWNLGYHHQHLQVVVKGNETVESVFNLGKYELDSVVNIPSGFKPEVSLVSQSYNSVQLRQNCDKCSDGVTIYYTSSSNPGMKLVAFRNKDDQLLTVGNLSAGSSYTFGPAMVFCDEVLETGKPLRVKTEPNPPTGIKVSVIEGRLIQVSWSPPKDHHADDYSYTGNVYIAKRTNREEISRVVSTIHKSVAVEIPENFTTGSKIDLRFNLASSYHNKTSIEVLRIHMEDKLQFLSCEDVLAAKSDWSAEVSGYCTEYEGKKSEKRDDEFSSCPQEIKTQSHFTEYCSHKCFSPSAENKYIAPTDRRTNHTFNLYSIFHSGVNLTLSCLPDYIFMNHLIRETKVKCSKGKWVPNIPKCVPMCPPPPPTMNGNLSVRKNIVTYSCSKGTFLYGKKELECAFNIWGPVEESHCLNTK